MYKISAQNIPKHVGEKCGKWADGDPDGRTDGESDGRTLPYHNTSRLKTGVYKWLKLLQNILPCKFKVLFM